MRYTISNKTLCNCKSYNKNNNEQNRQKTKTKSNCVDIIWILKKFKASKAIFEFYRQSAIPLFYLKTKRDLHQLSMKVSYKLSYRSDKPMTV
jgi:hypothetical protein